MKFACQDTIRFVPESDPVILSDLQREEVGIALENLVESGPPAGPCDDYSGGTMLFGVRLFRDLTFQSAIGWRRKA